MPYYLNEIFITLLMSRKCLVVYLVVIRVHNNYVLLVAVVESIPVKYKIWSGSVFISERDNLYASKILDPKSIYVPSTTNKSGVLSV